MDDYKELIAALREEAEAVQAIEWEIPICTSNHIAEAADAIEQLAKERDELVTKCHGLEKERGAAVADLEKCMNYAEPKNNNVCNFCKKDMSEYPDKCDGWSDFCKCEPEWRGV